MLQQGSCISTEHKLTRGETMRWEHQRVAANRQHNVFSTGLGLALQADTKCADMLGGKTSSRW